MNIALWIAASLLAMIALIGGSTKAFVSKERLAQAPGGEWTKDASAGFVRTLGILELLAAAGLLLPAILGIGTYLVPVTAICWVVLMVCAMIAHYRTGGFNAFMALNLAYLLIAAFIAWGRIGPVPFTS